MDIIISKTSKEPIYRQIRNQIRNSILKGSLKSGDILPSIRKLAKDLQVSVVTTKKAYEVLEQEGYIEFRLGTGSFVANKNLNWMEKQKYNTTIERIETLIEESLLLGINLDELKMIIINRIEEREKD
ncbi:GntR family transcriptional regulator [Priestia aryabhattai]|uniref:GntR family transcriptional regulator n=1 Tax=Priestia aryabhattai TaxID=412384 RepID=UPI002E1C12F8|nr:GntR family transcriptional regulator [Priestia aryabhattai]MED3922727.1 GntR family transcriptional regulator [Priestia aryabhattai]